MTYVKGVNQENLQDIESKDQIILQHTIEAAGTWSIEDAGPAVLGILHSKRIRKELLIKAILAVPAILPEGADDILDKFIDAKDEDIAEAAMEARHMIDGYDDEDDDEEMLWEDPERRDQSLNSILRIN